MADSQGLVSVTSPAIEDVAIDWCAPIQWVRRAR